jgi:hypothetical protein
MKRKKFRHIHRYAFVDIGERPWIYKSIYDLLTEPAKEKVKEKNGYIIDDTSDVRQVQHILRMLRARCGKSHPHPDERIKKNPNRGVRSLTQVPDNAIKRIPYWREK